MTDPATPATEQDTAQSDALGIEDPPTNIGGILRRLGPGLIIAGTIVGSGELIATTLAGAKAGFLLLWLIIIGCLIKVFVQIEFGKYTIINSKTTMDGMNEVPGPRLGGRRESRVNWVCWFWLVFIVIALAQVGGIIGGVGQAVSIQFPLTESGQAVNAYQDQQIEAKIQGTQAPTGEAPITSDPKIWAAIITVLSIGPLVLGRYRLVQNLSVVLVASFTLITIGNLVLLQTLPEWRVTWADFMAGMSFQIPEGGGATAALAAFGIIGVGATELIQYPYWCMEKGYAKWTGPRDEGEAWARRAEGWIRVLKWDAWCSMVVYTFATIAFYLLGAAILARNGLVPEKQELVRTLSEMYVPVFGDWAQPVFLLGAFVVLYSTFYIATASHARVLADATRVFGVSQGGDKAYAFWIRVFCFALPLLFLGCYVFVSDNPEQLVLAGGFMGALMLPILGVTALYFRYKRGDQRLLPSGLWDVFLWLSVAGLFLAGGWALYDKVIVRFL